MYQKLKAIDFLVGAQKNWESDLVKKARTVQLFAGSKSDRPQNGFSPPTDLQKSDISCLFVFCIMAKLPIAGKVFA